MASGQSAVLREDIWVLVVSLPSRYHVTLSKSDQRWMSWILRCFHFQIFFSVLDSWSVARHFVLPYSSVVNGTTLVFLSAPLSHFPKCWENLALQVTMATQDGSRAPASANKKTLRREDESLLICIACPLLESWLLTSLSLMQKG